MYSIKSVVALLIMLCFVSAISLKDHDGDCQCPSGYTKKGNDCHQNCLSGWVDDGSTCRLAEYNRGKGYQWKFGDPLNDSKMRLRCEAANGAGNCDKWGPMIYPKCKSGFYNADCCICRPSTPNCSALGFNDGTGLSCAKKIILDHKC